MEHRLARLVQMGILQSRYFGRAKTKFRLYLEATVANLTLVDAKADLSAGTDGDSIADSALRAGSIRSVPAWLAKILSPALLASVALLKHISPNKAFRPEFQVLRFRLIQNRRCGLAIGRLRLRLGVLPPTAFRWRPVINSQPEVAPSQFLFGTRVRQKSEMRGRDQWHSTDAAVINTLAPLRNEDWRGQPAAVNQTGISDVSVRFNPLPSMRSTPAALPFLVNASHSS